MTVHSRIENSLINKLINIKQAYEQADKNVIKHNPRRGKNNINEN